MELIEQARLQLQDHLDGQKTQLDRNKLGQFATPSKLSQDVLDTAKILMKPKERVRFLDPAFGTGAFYSALLNSFTPKRIESALAFEIDGHYGLRAKELWCDSLLRLELKDFTKANPPDTDGGLANLIVCNPPYVRHHHLGATDKIRLKQRSEELSGQSISGLAGLYCHFLLHAHAWMAQNGLALWLIPSEFMDVNYGDAVKRYLLESVTLLRVHRFDPANVQFSDALVSSAVVIFRKASPPKNHAVDFSYGGSLLQAASSRTVPIKILHASPKWTAFPKRDFLIEDSEVRLRLGDLFDVKRGIATGSNDFFIFTPERATELRIPNELLTPVLPSPRYCQTECIKGDANGFPKIDRPLMLLNVKISEQDLCNKYPAAWEYIQEGRRQGIDARYLCQNRSPWFAQERRLPAPILCTYMGRQRDGRLFRFILNESGAIATNVYLLLYPRPNLQAIMAKSPNILRRIWENLNQLPPEVLIGAGRVYGGGLHKVEPKELRSANVSPLITLVPELEQLLGEQVCLS